MVKEEIVEGLKYAIAKGESLPKAMMSFYNAGYSKRDIEEAARALQVPQLPQIQTAQPIQIQAPQLAKQPIQPRTQTRQPIKQPLQPLQAPAPVVIQRVSAYEQRPRPGKAIMFLLIFALILLFGILVAVFLFRDELADILSRIL